jgi:hypothetical protein
VARSSTEHELYVALKVFPQMIEFKAPTKRKQSLSFEAD